MKSRFWNIILAAVFLLGASVMLYPPVSEWWNGKVQSKAIINYSDTLDAMSGEDYSQLFEAAEDYNRRLAATELGFYAPELVEGYSEALSVDGSDIMGYIVINKIDVTLPIYHGTGEEVLSKGAGHLEGSSLPIGGEGTHTVISAHRGLPTAKMFTNLDRLEIGDVFTLYIYNRELSYEVDSILTVDPDDTDALLPAEGEDYCTLLTCTPYGINTKRLLVRGHRVENERTGGITVYSEAYKLGMEYTVPVTAVPLIGFALIFVSVRYRPKKRI